MATTHYTTADLRRLWLEKVTRDVPLTQAEKDMFIAAYWDGQLPKVGYELGQWVEDGCRSFNALDGRDG